MATKVEELRARMLGNDPCYDMDDEGNMIQKGTVPHCIGIKAEELDSLIAAAREEGRAEGAEQERERIRKAADHYEAEDELPYAELVDGNYVGASCEIYVIPASVLAPDKESEK